MTDLRRAIQAIVVVGFVLLLLSAPANSAPEEFQTAVMGDEPLLYYQFNEQDGNVINYGSLGSNFDGVIFGDPGRGVKTSTGDSGIQFRTGDEFVQSLQSAPESLTGNPSFSVETIIFIPLQGTAGLWAPFLHWGDSTPNPTSKSVYFSFSGNSPLEIYAGFYNGGLQAPAEYAPLGKWHHVLWVHEGGGTDLEGTTLYIDGLDVTSYLVPDPELCCNGSTPAVTTTEFRVNRARDKDGQRFFTGTMDELALYGRTLTAEEASEHFRLLNEIFKDGYEEK